MENSSLTSNIENIKAITGLITACAGVVILIFGFKYCIKVFDLIFDFLKDPDKLNEILDIWVKALNWEAFNLSAANTTYPVSSILALFVFAGALVVLAMLAMAMMRTGAQIVSWMTSEREAVKEILQHAFGKNLKPNNKDHLLKSDSSKY